MTLRVASDVMRQHGSQIRAAAGQILESNTQATNSAVQIQDAWEGDAKAQFDLLFQKWQSGAKQMQEGLDGIANLIDSAATNYDNAEQQIKSSFNQG